VALVYTYVYFATKVDMTENIKYSIKYKNIMQTIQTTRQRRREIKNIGTVMETITHTHMTTTR